MIGGEGGTLRFQKYILNIQRVTITRCALYVPHFCTGLSHYGSKHRAFTIMIQPHVCAHHLATPRSITVDPKGDGQPQTMTPGQRKRSFGWAWWRISRTMKAGPPDRLSAQNGPESVQKPGVQKRL